MRNAGSQSHTGNGLGVWVNRDFLTLLRIDLYKAPEIQQMYSLNMPISEIRTKIRQEFERHRYVNQLPVVDMLLFQNHSEYQVETPSQRCEVWTGISTLKAHLHWQ